MSDLFIYEFFYVIEPEIADTMLRPYIRFYIFSISLASKNGLTKHMNIVWVNL